MNRRDFFKVLGLGIAGLVAPKWTTERNDMTTGDILAKMGKGETLTNEEQQKIRLWGNQMDFNNAYISGLQNGSSDVNAKTINSLDFPISVIFSKQLEKDTASIKLEIPSVFKHVLIFSSGRSTAAGTGVVALQARFNSDTGSNYESQLLYGISSTAGSVTSAVTDYAIIGGLPKSGEAAGYSGTGFAFLPACGGSLYKTTLMTIVPGVAGYIFARSSTWKSTEVIRSIEFSAESGNLEAGFSLSLYGLK